MELKAAWKTLYLLLIFFTVTCSKTRALTLKAGKDNVTATAPWLFSCKNISFDKSYPAGRQVYVFASVSHSVKSPTPRNGAAVWVENVTARRFTVCVLEFGDGSNGTTEINWIAMQTVPRGSQLGTAFLRAWNAKTKCQKIYFEKRFKTLPTVFVTASHQSPNRPQDAMAVWVEDVENNNFKLCFRETKIFGGTHKSIKINWMALTDVTFTKSIVFNNTASPSHQHNNAFCQTINFTTPFFSPPVVVVTPKYSYNNTYPYLSQCNAVTAWIEHSSTKDMKVCVRNYNSNPKSEDIITVDYMTIGGFQFQRGRRHMPHIPTLGYSHCEVIRLNPSLFNPDKSIEVQITINHMDTSNKSYVHDAAVSWVENASYHSFTACVMAAGFNERKSHANVTVEWMAYQGYPVGGSAGKLRMSQWWSGTTCKAVNFPLGKFLVKPSVLVTAEHHHSGLKRDAASVWIEDVTQSSCKICLRELQNYAGSHENISVNWLAFTDLHKSPFSEHNSIYFKNNKPPPGDNNNAFCKDVNFTNFYNNTPEVFVAAEHSSKGGHLSPVHNDITAWVEYINKTTGFRVCFKELFVAKYDPLSIIYAVLPGNPDYWMDSAILNDNAFYQSRLHQFLTPAVGSNHWWLLCYRASTHGWAVSTFHSRCDGKRDTVTIVKKGQYVFGGYTDIPWDSSSGYGYSSKAFIFSLRNKEGLGPFKSMVTTPRYAIYRNSGYGPTFGGGHDIYIADNANSNTKSYTAFGSYYSVPSGVQSSSTILAGTKYFTPDEVEVFYLV
ncbi:hypothetical protein ACROYT_G031033 [Oculina patagonica]